MIMLLLLLMTNKECLCCSATVDLKSISPLLFLTLMEGQENFIRWFISVAAFVQNQLPLSFSFCLLSPDSTSLSRSHDLQPKTILCVEGTFITEKEIYQIISIDQHERIDDGGQLWTDQRATVNPQTIYLSSTTGLRRHVTLPLNYQRSRVLNDGFAC